MLADATVRVLGSLVLMPGGFGGKMTRFSVLGSRFSVLGLVSSLSVVSALAAPPTGDEEDALDDGTASPVLYTEQYPSGIESGVALV